MLGKAYSLTELNTMFKAATQSATPKQPMMSPTPKPAASTPIASVPTKFQSAPLSDQQVMSSRYGSSPQEQLINGGSIRNISSIPTKVFQAPLKGIEAPLGVAAQVIPGGNQAVNWFQNIYHKVGATPTGKVIKQVGKSLMDGIFNFAATAIEEPWLVKHSLDAMGKTPEEQAKIWNNYIPVIKDKAWLEKPVQEQVKDTAWDTVGTMATLAPFAKGAGVALPFLSKIPGAAKALETITPVAEKVGEAAWKVPTAMATTGAALYGSQQVPVLKNQTIQKGLDTRIIPEGTGRDVADMAASLAVRPLEAAKTILGGVSKVAKPLVGEAETIGQRVFGGTENSRKAFEAALTKAGLDASPENVAKYQSMYDDWLNKSAAQQWAKEGAAPTTSRKIQYAQAWMKNRSPEEAALDFVEHQNALQTVYKGTKDKKIVLEGKVIDPGTVKPNAIYNKKSANLFQQAMENAPTTTATTVQKGMPQGRLNVLNKETWTRQELQNLISEFQLARKQYGKNFGVEQYLQRKITKNPGLADLIGWWDKRSTSYMENLKRLKAAAESAPALAEGIKVPGFSKFSKKYKLGYAGKEAWIPFAEPTVKLGNRTKLGSLMDTLFRPIEFSQQQYASMQTLRKMLKDKGMNEYEITQLLSDLRSAKNENQLAKTYADLPNQVLRSKGERFTTNNPKGINLDNLDSIVNQAFRPKFSQDPIGSLTRRPMETSVGKAAKNWLTMQRYVLDPRFATYETVESPFWGAVNGVNPAGKITESAQNRWLKQTKFKHDAFSSGAELLSDVNPEDLSGAVRTDRLGTIMGKFFGGGKADKAKNPLQQFAETGGVRKPEIAAMQLEKEYYDNALQFLKSKGMRPATGQDARAFVDAMEKQAKQSSTINEVTQGLADAEAKAFEHAKNIHYYPSSKSMVERTLNHWLVSWPFSYNFKVGKEIGKILYDKALGKNTGMLGAAVLSKIQDKEQTYEQSHPDYAHFKQQYKPVIDALMYAIPVDPVNQYVRLNPMTSYVLSAALFHDVWNETNGGKEVSGFLNKLQSQTTGAGVGYTLPNAIKSVQDIEKLLQSNFTKTKMENGQYTPLKF